MVVPSEVCPNACLLTFVFPCIAVVRIMRASEIANQRLISLEKEFLLFVPSAGNVRRELYSLINPGAMTDMVFLVLS